MPISTTNRKAGPYPGNGVARAFSFNFKVFNTTELRVSVASADGLEQVLQPDVNYTVGLNPDQDADAGGVVTLNAPLQTGSRLVILSAVPALQPIDMTNQGGFYPDTVNEGLDRVTALVQQFDEKLGRAITVPPSFESGGLNLPEPKPGQLVAWNDNGGLSNLDPAGLVNIVAYGSSVVDLFNGDGISTVFNLSASPGTQRNMRVSVAGVVQTPGEDFEWGGGQVLRFTSAPPVGTRIVAQFQEALPEFGSAQSDLSNVDPATGRDALGLGDASTKNVGSGAGTVAAGDDARLQAVGGKADADGGNLSSTFAAGIPYKSWSAKDEFDQVLYAARFKTANNTWPDAIDAALSAANTSGPTLIKLPRGDLQFDRTVWVKNGRTTIEGEGVGSTVIYAMFGDADVFLFRHPTIGSMFLASVVRKLSITVHPSFRPASSGCAVSFDGVGECEAHDITCSGTHNGIGFFGNNRNCRTRNVGGSDIVHAEFFIDGGGNQHLSLPTAFDNTGVGFCGVLVTETERADIAFGTTSHYNIGLNIRPAAGKTVQNVFSNFGDYDAPAQGGVVIDASAADSVARNIFISGGSAGSASSYFGLETKKASTGQVGDIWVSNAMLQSNLEEGCSLGAGRVHFDGVHVANNGSKGSFSGVRLLAGLEFFQMTGGASGAILGGPDKTARPMAWEGNKGYGVLIDSGFAGTASFVGVDLRGNALGPVQNNSTTASASFTACPGYKNLARGVATITSGTSYVTVSPGLDVPIVNKVTPILLSCLDNPNLAGVENVFVGATTSSSFDIATSPFLNVSSDLRVAWQVGA